MRCFGVSPCFVKLIVIVGRFVRQQCRLDLDFNAFTLPILSQRPRGFRHAYRCRPVHNGYERERRNLLKGGRD